MLGKISGSCLWAVLLGLIVKGKTIQCRLHLIRFIIEQVDNGDALINLDHSKSFHRVNLYF